MAKARFIREIQKQLRAASLPDHTVEQSRGNYHYIIRDPGGNIVVVMPGSPGDNRWPTHLRVDIRRAARKHLAKSA